MNHSELGDTYLTLLEAVEQTALSEAEVVLHSEEVWMYCPKVSKKEQLIKDTEADVVSNWVEQQAIKPLAMVTGCKWPSFISAFMTDETLQMLPLEVYLAPLTHHFH